MLGIGVNKGSIIHKVGLIAALMRARFARSTLGDNPRFVRDLEAALRFAWQDWCRQPERAAG